MKASKVKPQRWTNENLLYEDESYSIVWGNFDEAKQLGVRWNGKKKEKGFPKQGKYPLWFVVPDEIALSILHHLQFKVVEKCKKVNYEKLIFALSELTEKLIK
jgi:hypothetical protein